MIVYLLRLFIYTLLPLVLALWLAHRDRFAHNRARKLELLLIYQFGFGVLGGGIANFAGHLFWSDLVAESIGWPVGSLFQLEMGFTNLALGILGLVAATRRDGFREATVLAITVVGVGATLVHLLDIVQHGNLAPGNTWQNVANLVRPALLIGFLRASRQADQVDGSPELHPHFGRWQTSHAQAAGWMAGIVATGFGIGFAFDQPVWGTGVGVVVAAVVIYTLFRQIQATLPVAHPIDT